MVRRATLLEKKKCPKHVAIILDGNGRWAKKRGHVRTYGHKFGAANVRNIVMAAGEMGIEVITLYAFSTENWKRPNTEVQFLMKLFNNYLMNELRALVNDNVQLHIVGDISALSESLQQNIKDCEEETRENTGVILNIAINYGGRQEILQAVQSIASEVENGVLSAKQIDLDTIRSHLYPSSSDDVDLMIRTGGESRISNFLLWQISYGELYFTPTLWPDFTVEDFKAAIIWFSNRERRYGGLVEAINQ